MKKRLYTIIAAIMLVLVISTVVYAAYEYSFPIYVSDESGSARSYVPVMLGFGAQSLVDSGKISATGTDTNMGGIDYMLASEEVNAVIPSLPANANATLTLYTGFTPLATAFSIILGQGGYFTVNDTAALELGDDFSLLIEDTYLDTSVADVIAEKPSAISLTTDGAGNVAGDMWGEVPYNISFTGHTGVTLGALYSGSQIKAGQKFPDFPACTLDSVQMYMKKQGAPTGTGYLRVLKVSDDSVIGTMGTIDVATLTTTATWYTFSTDVVLAEETDIRIVFEYSGGNSSNVVIVFGSPSNESSTSGGTVYHTASGWYDYPISAGSECGLKLDYTKDEILLSVSAAVPSGHYDTLELVATGTDLDLDLDGVTVDTVALGGASVPDNANDWQIMSDAVSYMGSFTFEVGGATVAEYNPTDIVRGTTYDTGTVTVTNGDATVVGNATAWTSDMEGSAFVSADGYHYVVDSVSDATHLELTIVYAGGTLGAQTYDMYPCLQNETTADAYVGAITWGSNTNIDISYGTMGVSDSTDVETSGEEGGFTMPDAFMPSTWFASGDNVEDLPFYDMIRNAAVGIYGADPDDLQEGVQTIYFIIIIGMAMAAFLGLVLYTRSALLGLLAMLIILFVGSSATIIPMWIPFVVLLIDIGIMFLYRQVAY